MRCPCGNNEISSHCIHFHLSLICATTSPRMDSARNRKSTGRSQMLYTCTINYACKVSIHLFHVSQEWIWLILINPWIYMRSTASAMCIPIWADGVGLRLPPEGWASTTKRNNADARQLPSYLLKNLIVTDLHSCSGIIMNNPELWQENDWNEVGRKTWDEFEGSTQYYNGMVIIAWCKRPTTWWCLSARGFDMRTSGWREIWCRSPVACALY